MTQNQGGGVKGLTLSTSFQVLLREPPLSCFWCTRRLAGTHAGLPSSRSLHPAAAEDLREKLESHLARDVEEPKAEPWEPAEP